ncbi:MAG: ATP-binding cassette domain-containing protein [Alphaproteobacteria bacterium]|jgi:ABC-type multidrug transport system ATPase subunit|nr:ATP-binding cassette domain-containing protein [Alphaproteobacteria bacterium]MDP7428745.1 ATP-binding cassette domain-containing protein [Alphaproteobacteria bacterium]
MLSVEGLRRPGLAPVTLGIEGGQCLGLSGPSGAGKTLLLRAIADLDKNSGEVRCSGVARSGISAPAWRRRVAYLAAHAGWWAEEVGEHFESREDLAQLLPRLGLPEAVLEWPVARLSTGERQRLVLLRTLALEPQVLLLDEPTAGLDPEAVAQVESLLRGRLAAGVAILLVSHSAEQLERIAGRRLRLEGGVLQGSGR